jgi:glutathione S-transferase
MSRCYVSVDEAITLPGLRVAFSQGLPAPWGEAVRAILDLKQIPYSPVTQVPGGDNEALLRWTGQTSAPVAVYGAERPRSHWAELLLLAERLGPEPRLIPADEEQRALLFGLCHAIAGEDGLGWNIRLLLLDMLERENVFPVESMKAKYTEGKPLEQARHRLNSAVAMLARRLTDQAAKGSRYFIGEQLTAVDLYWAAFSNLLSAMDADICAMPSFYRLCAEFGGKQLAAGVPSVLIDHRDHIVRRYFSVPMWF